MRLRTRLALVLVALVLVPLVAAAVLVTYTVPRAAGDRADSLVLGTRSAVVDDLTRQCDAVATAAVVVGRGVASTSPPSSGRGARSRWRAWGGSSSAETCCLSASIRARLNSATAWSMLEARS